MRLALAFVFIAGCVQTYSDPGPGPDPGGGWTGPSGGPIYGCTKDADCDAKVCARDGSCYLATNIRAVHVTWTVHGDVASATSCAGSRYLQIRFSGSGAAGGSISYAPVPCANGKYTMDKLPIAYTQVELGLEGGETGTTATIDRTTGDAVIDLP